MKYTHSLVYTILAIVCSSFLQNQASENPEQSPQEKFLLNSSHTVLIEKIRDDIEKTNNRILREKERRLKKEHTARMIELSQLYNAAKAELTARQGDCDEAYAVLTLAQHQHQQNLRNIENKFAEMFQQGFEVGKTEARKEYEARAVARRALTQHPTS